MNDVEGLEALLREVGNIATRSLRQEWLVGVLLVVLGLLRSDDRGVHEIGALVACGRGLDEAGLITEARIVGRLPSIVSRIPMVVPVVRDVRVELEEVRLDDILLVVCGLLRGDD